MNILDLIPGDIFETDEKYYICYAKYENSIACIDIKKDGSSCGFRTFITNREVTLIQDLDIITLILRFVARLSSTVNGLIKS